MGDLTRRDFLKIASAAALFLTPGICGCRQPEERIVPFSKPIGEVKPGEPVFYATAMPSRMSAIPLLVKCVDYHPIKIEGNRLVPGGGGTNKFAQAALFSLYDPLRASRFLMRKKGEPVVAEAEEVWSFLNGLLKEFEKVNGEGLCLLTGQSSSPSRQRLIDEHLSKYPRSRWFVHEPIDLDFPNRAISELFKQDVAVLYDLSKANVIVSLDCDFLNAEEESIVNAKNFAISRDPQSGKVGMSRLYCIEAGLSLTGASADHRLAVKSSDALAIVSRLAFEICGAKKLFDKAILEKLRELSAPAEKYKDWIAICAKDLLNSENAGGKKPLVMAGYRQPMIVHFLAMAINYSLNATGETVLIKNRKFRKPDGDVKDLARLLNEGEVKSLIILGANPVYDAPVELDWTDRQKKAKTVIKLGLYEDETAMISDVHIPMKHFLECWESARRLDGTLLSVQPVIQTLWKNCVSELELFSRLCGMNQADYDIARHTFNQMFGAKEEDWKRFVRDGFVLNSGWNNFEAKRIDFEKLQKLLHSTKPSSDESAIEIDFYRSDTVDDGRYYTNIWLQETPDPITKVVWDNPALVSPTTAEKSGILRKKEGIFKKDDTRNAAICPVVEIELNGGSVRCPVLIQPGMADGVVALALGYGRNINSDFGKTGFKIGFNFYRLRNGINPHFSAGARIKPIENSFLKIARVQGEDWNPAADIIVEGDIDTYQKEPSFVSDILKKVESGKSAIVKSGKPLYESQRFDGIHQWGMAIDLNRCIGCGACITACRSENNIPVVGKDQILRGREMDWLRVDRYYRQDKSGGVYVRFQPLMCMHCETAPCEYVCPVNATVHDSEGLNVMVYNRCIGARYCLNNCPYRVRRFNYFDYNNRITDEIYGLQDLDVGLVKSILNKLSAGSQSETVETLLTLIRNPDVTVRMRGVMEKCTYCIQRIQQAKAKKKVRVGDSPDVMVEDGAIKTACEQACPTEAIVFGNLADKESRLSKLVKSDRNYQLLGYLNTKPRTTYLAKITNPNAELMKTEKNAEQG